MTSMVFAQCPVLHTTVAEMHCSYLSVTCSTRQVTSLLATFKADDSGINFVGIAAVSHVMRLVLLNRVGYQHITRPSLALYAIAYNVTLEIVAAFFDLGAGGIRKSLSRSLAIDVVGVLLACVLLVSRFTSIGLGPTISAVQFRAWSPKSWVCRVLDNHGRKKFLFFLDHRNRASPGAVAPRSDSKLFVSKMLGLKRLISAPSKRKY